MRQLFFTAREFHFEIFFQVSVFHGDRVYGKQKLENLFQNLIRELERNGFNFIHGTFGG